MASPTCCYGPPDENPECGQAAAVVRGTEDAMQLCLPAWCFTEKVWMGVSYIVYEFHVITNLDQIAFITLNRYKTDDYVLAVRTANWRFLFWTSRYAVIPQSYEWYNGQPISTDAVFEIWNTSKTLSVTSDGFCIPIIKAVPSCDSECNGPMISVRPNKKLWARLCKVPSYVDKV